jgi:hypothetical protein
VNLSFRSDAPFIKLATNGANALDSTDDAPDSLKDRRSLRLEEMLVEGQTLRIRPLRDELPEFLFQQVLLPAEVL